MSFFSRWFTTRPYILPADDDGDDFVEEIEEIKEIKENTAVLTINFRDGSSMWMTATGGDTESSFDDFEDWWKCEAESYVFTYAKGKQMVQREFINGYNIKFDITEPANDALVPANNVVPLKLVK